MGGEPTDGLVVSLGRQIAALGAGTLRLVDPSGPVVGKPENMGWPQVVGGVSGVIKEMVGGWELG